MEAFSLVGKMKLDGSKEVEQQLQKTKASLESVAKGLKVAGAALTAVGVAGLKLSSDARKLNAELSTTAITLGASTKEMRDLALATTNVTFPLQSVIDTFDILAKAGVKDTAVLQDAATAFDTLGDAVGSNAETMADVLIPAFKALGEDIPQTTEELDKFTWLAEHTTTTIEEFGSVMNYVAMYGENLNVSLDDMVAIMAVLESKGKGGATATRLFRTAVNQASDGAVTLNEALGISQSEIDAFREEIDSATGSTQQYADAANTQYGIMDKLKQKWNEVALVIGSFLEPLEGVLAGFTALGPVLLSASLILPKLSVAIAAVRGAFSAMLGPVGLAVTAIGALAAGIAALIWKTKSSGPALDKWQAALDKARKRLEELKEAGDFTSDEVNRLTERIEILERALSRYDTVAKDAEVTEWNYVEALRQHASLSDELEQGQIDVAKAAKKLNEAVTETRGELFALQQQYLFDNLLKRTEEAAGDLTAEMGGLEASLKEHLFTMDDWSAAYAAADDAQKAMIDGWREEKVALDEFNATLADAEAELANAETAYNDAVITQAGYKDSLDKANIALSLLERELPLAEAKLKTYSDAIEDATTEVSKWEQSMADAKAELYDLASPNLEGMKEFEDQIFKIDQEIKQLELAKLQGVEVLDTGVAVDDQIAALRDSRRELELQRDLKFDPLIKEFEDATDAALGLNEEILPEDVRNRIAELAKSIGPEGEIGIGLADANTKLETQTGLYNDQLPIVEELRQRTINWQTEVDTLNEKITDALDVKQDAVDLKTDVVGALKGIEQDGGVHLDATQEKLTELLQSGERALAVLNEINRLQGGTSSYVTSPPYASPSIPQMDTGGIVRGPGLFSVGAGVTEIVRAPGSGVVISGNNFYVRDEADIDAIAQSLVRQIRLRTGLKV